MNTRKKAGRVMSNEELNSLSEEDRYLVVGIEDGWINPTNEDLERYYELTGVDIHPVRTLITKTINRFKGFEINEIVEAIIILALIYGFIIWLKSVL